MNVKREKPKSKKLPTLYLYCYRKNCTESNIMSTAKSGEYVNVGEEVGLENQYLGIDGSTFIENGKVFAAIPGYLELNEEKRTIRIDQKNNDRKTPKPGDLITGQIYSIRRNSVGVKILTLNNQLVVDLGLVGNIHISKIASKYINKIESVFMKQDLIRAEIIKKQISEYQLKCDKPNLGVIKSYCKYCGKVLERKGKEQVVCPFCSHTERKTMASDYNDIQLQLVF